MFNEYPYVNLQDVNLDWILKHIKDLETNLQDFVKLNTIKYADPIIWNITKQYETNTVVIDGNTGTAYLSVQPVPTGVALTNTDYWSVIFTLNLTTSNQNITFRDDGTNVVATFASNTGDWLLWNFYLYRVTQPIAVNTPYVVGFNLERFSVELFIRDYISTLAAIIGDLDDLTTSDKDSIVDAINSVLSDLNDMIGDLDDLTTNDKDSIVDAINELVAIIGDLADLNTINKTSIVNAINSNFSGIAYVTPEMFGAVGDGVEDDTAAFNAAIAVSKGMILRNTYKVAEITINKDYHIIGYGAKIVPDLVSGTSLYKNVFYQTAGTFIIEGVEFESTKSPDATTTNCEPLFKAFTTDAFILRNCFINNVGHNYVSEDGPLKDYHPTWLNAVDVLNIDIEGCVFYAGGGDEVICACPWYSSEKTKITIKNNIFRGVRGASLNIFAHELDVSDNLFDGYVYLGSIINAGGGTLKFDNNTFTNCSTGSCFDLSEGGIFWEETAIITNNTVPDGTIGDFLMVNKCNLICTGNIIHGSGFVRHELTVYHDDVCPPPFDNLTAPENLSVIIADNKMFFTAQPSFVIRVCSIAISHDSDIPRENYLMQSQVIIKNNQIQFESYYTSGSRFISLIPIIRNVTISDNTIINPNRDNLSGAAKYFIHIDGRYTNEAYKIEKLSFNDNYVELNSALNNGLYIGAIDTKTGRTNTYIGTLITYINVCNYAQHIGFNASDYDYVKTDIS